MHPCQISRVKQLCPLMWPESLGADFPAAGAGGLTFLERLQYRPADCKHGVSGNTGRAAFPASPRAHSRPRRSHAECGLTGRLLGAGPGRPRRPHGVGREKGSLSRRRPRDPGLDSHLARTWCPGARPLPGTHQTRRAAPPSQALLTQAPGRALGREPPARSRDRTRLRPSLAFVPTIRQEESAPGRRPKEPTRHRDALGAGQLPSTLSSHPSPLSSTALWRHPGRASRSPMGLQMEAGEELGPGRATLLLPDPGPCGTLQQPRPPAPTTRQPCLQL